MIILKHIVIILGDIYDLPSANVICMKKIADQLVVEGYKITFVCQAQKSNQLDYIEFDGYNVFFINVLSNRLWYYANMMKNASAKTIKTFFWKSILLYLRILQGIRAMFFWPSSSRWFIKKAFVKLKKINDANKIDCIITVSIPYEAHLSGYKFKSYNKEVNWITYTLDSFAYSPTLQKYYIFKMFKKIINKRSEAKVFKNANANFLSLALKGYDDKMIYPNSLKNHWISFPLIQEYKQQVKTEYFDRSKINVVYAGSFYKVIRNPEYCLSLFSMIKNEEIILHLYHRGDCLDTVEKYTRLSDRIIAYGSLPVEKIYEVESQADVLLNIGNNVPHFYPSKLLEYISFGKPIINFHDKRYDYNCLLYKYPLVLNIENNGYNYEKDIDRLVHFCKENKNQQIKFEKIESLYWESTPKHISSLFLKEIEK